MGRVLASFRLLRKLRQLRPDVLVVGAAEQLPAGLWWRWRTGGRLLYDVRENYALNVRSQRVFPRFVAAPLAWLIERVEQFAAPRLTHALLAERSYLAELPWLRACPHAVIENKYQPPTPPSSATHPAGPLTLLVSGTLNEVYGTFDAVRLIDALHAREPGAVRLHLIGYCPRPADFERLQKLVATRPYVTLTGGNALVAHEQIVTAIRAADVGLLPYQPNPSTWRCLPTKLWEYLGEQLPVVVPPNPLWQMIVAANSAGFSFDFQQPEPDPTRFLAALRGHGFYPRGAPAAAYWTTEQQRLRDVFLPFLLT